MFVAALAGGISKMLLSFELVVVHRALVGLHCGMYKLNWY